MSRDFRKPDSGIRKHGDHLPHWQQGEAMQFVAFRLDDALPKDNVIQWKEKRRVWILNRPKPVDSDTEAGYHRMVTWEIETWLDQGAGVARLPKLGKDLSGSGTTGTR
jgi:hypothetical protein